jgi:hypothetical protein
MDKLFDICGIASILLCFGGHMPKRADTSAEQYLVSHNALTSVASKANTSISLHQLNPDTINFFL